MSRFPTFLACFLGAAVVFGLSGCGSTENSKIDAKPDPGLAKLSAADRAVAEKQKFCPISNKLLGGKMGKPIKLTLKKTDFFICCSGCKEEAEKDPDKVLAQVKKLNAKK